MLALLRLFGYNWSGGPGGLGELDLFVNRGTGSSGGLYVYDYLNNVATLMYSANMTTFSFGTSALSASGSNGSSGQVLTGTGTGTNWTTVGVNVASQYTWTNTQTFSNVITFSNNILGTNVNAASHTVGTSSIVNATGVYTGVINAASHTVGTSSIVNATGVYTGVINGTSHTIGTSFTVNATAINIGSLILIANTTQGGAGQILTSNSIGGTYWGSPAQGGTVTSVATGNGILGGTFTASGTVYATAGPGIIVNTQGICFQANTGLVVNSAGVFVNTAGISANVGIVSNSFGLFVNAAYIATINANNAAYLGGTAAGSYALTSALSSYATHCFTLGLSDDSRTFWSGRCSKRE